MAHLKKCCLEHVKRHIKVPVCLKVACAFKGKKEIKIRKEHEYVQSGNVLCGVARW